MSDIVVFTQRLLSPWPLFLPLSVHPPLVTKMDEFTLVLQPLGFGNNLGMTSLRERDRLRESVGVQSRLCYDYRRDGARWWIVLNECLTSNSSPVPRHLHLFFQYRQCAALCFKTRSRSLWQENHLKQAYWKNNNHMVIQQCLLIREDNHTHASLGRLWEWVALLFAGLRE